MKKLLLLPVFCFFICLQVIAQGCYPAGAWDLYEKAMKSINTRHVNWVKKTSADIKSGKTSSDDLPAIAGAYRHETLISGMDIEALMFLVLMEASKDANEDLRDILERMKKQNEEKKKLRDAVKRLKENQKDQKELLRAEYDSLKKLIILVPGRINLQVAQLNKPVTKTEINNLLDELRDKLDSLSEMGEMESLRLQMAMDRLSKMMSTLSNLLKKISDTADSIIQNLK